MLRKLLYLLRLFIFWLIYFQVCRGIFVAYNHQKYKGLGGSEILSSFIHALPLDLSATCYLLVIPFLVTLISNYIHLDKFTLALSAYNYVALVVLTILNLADTALYQEWGYKLNAYAMSFTRYPKEVIASMQQIPYVWIILIMVAAIGLFGLGLHRLVHLHDYALKNNVIKGIRQHLKVAGIFLVTLFGIFTGIRGGLGTIPINQSAVFFSGKTILNHTAVNTAWNLLYSYINSGNTSLTNPYPYFSEQTAKEKIRPLYAAGNDSSTLSILRIPKPNILFVLLESWTADVIEQLGGEKDLTNGFNQLSKEGLLFTNIYANGDRTDKGIVAVLSAYPSQTQTSIITQPEKMEKLPALTSPFLNQGYQSAFYYGGDAGFANMRAYLYHCGFNKLADKSSFSSKDMNSKWGAHDGVLFNRVLSDLKNEKQPFFYSMLTLSSHEPFEIPIESKIKSTNEADLFRNAIWYSDKCLYDFLEAAKKEAWYNNTLIVLVADHGHRLPKNYVDLSVPGKFRIPLLFLGGALKQEMRGTICNKTGNQTDIAHTLLAQMQWSAADFKWSKNLLNEQSADFAYYTFNDGIGWIYKNEQLVFDNVSKRITYPYQNNFADTTLSKMEYGKAYLRLFYDDYLLR